MIVFKHKVWWCLKNEGNILRLCIYMQNNWNNKILVHQKVYFVVLGLERNATSQTDVWILSIN